MTTDTHDLLELTLEEERAAEEEALRETQEAAFRPSAAGWIPRIALVSLAIGFVFALPLLLPLGYQHDLVSAAATFAIVGLSMNVLVGYLGQLSLGHQAFFGIGAFASAVVATEYGLGFVGGVAAGALTGAVTAVALGYVSLRVRGLYLAIVTLAYGILAEESIFNIGFLARGVPADRPLLFQSSRAYAYLCLAALAVFFVLDWRLIKSKAGRAILAVRDDERVAASFGINVRNMKLFAFIISGTVAGIAGALFAHRLGAVDAAAFDLQMGLTFVLMTVVGGLRNRVGIIIGASIFATLDQLLVSLAQNVLHNQWLEDYSPIIIPIIGALLLVVTLIQFPGGIGQQLQPIQNWVRGRRFDIHAMKEQQGMGGGGMVGRP